MKIPAEWIVDWAGLHCTLCGKLIGGRGGTFEQVQAGTPYLDSQVQLHKCQQEAEANYRTPEQLAFASQAMKQIRLLNGPMTFEQECQEYGKLLKQQTTAPLDGERQNKS